MNSDGSNVQKLAEGWNFILSPDGSKILFLFVPQGYSGELNAYWWLMESDGSNKKKLLPFNNPSFNPDGSKICYYILHPTGYYWVQREWGGNWTRLDHEPTPEEGEFILHEMEELADIWVMDIAGGSKTKIASNIPATLLSNIAPTLFAVSEWSPDGERILFQTSELSNNAVNIDIWTMNEDGSHKKRLTDYTGSDLAPRWSPDGEKIAYVSGGLSKYSYEIWGRHSYSCEIWVINPDGSGKRKLTRNTKVRPWFDWSPDGREIAYVSTDIDFALGLEHNKSEIWVMKADGSNKKLLLSIAANGGNMDIHQIKWKPDSSQIAFEIRGFSGNPGDLDIYLRDVPRS
jgi:Tol biopolymer transport system component